MNLPNTTQFAVLIHTVDWALDHPSIQIDDTVSLNQLANSPVAALYRTLCRTQLIDGGEPAGYSACFNVVTNDLENSIGDIADPSCTVNRLVSVLSAVLATPVWWSRLIWSLDGYASSLGTVLLHSGGPETECLAQDHSLHLDSVTADRFAIAWRTADRILARDKNRGRISNSLTYFYYASTSPTLDQSCVNLAMVLESLFAPYTSSESTHQVSFNISKFSGTSRDDRKSIYTFFKRFYSLRAAILHGGNAEYAELEQLIPRAYAFVSRTLATILLDSQLADTFSIEGQRRELFDQYLFQ